MLPVLLINTSEQGMRVSGFCKLFLVLIAVLSHCVLADVLPQFPEESIWRQNISSAAVHPDSKKMLDTVDLLGGFGGNVFRIDFSMRVVRADESAPMLELVSLLNAEEKPIYYAGECD